MTTAKSVSEDSDDKSCNARRIHDLVVGIVPPEANSESILPHEGGQNMDYNVGTNADGTSDRDPLESVDRTSDTLYVF